MKDAFETLQVVRKEGDVVLVELCRPDVLNAMNTQMGRDLRELFMHLSANPHEARCIVLTGNGMRRRRPQGTQRNDRCTMAGAAPDL